MSYETKVVPVSKRTVLKHRVDISFTHFVIGALIGIVSFATFIWGEKDFAFVFAILSNLCFVSVICFSEVESYSVTEWVDSDGVVIKEEEVSQ